MKKVFLWSSFLVVFLSVFGGIKAQLFGNDIKKWAVSYNNTTPVSDFEPYDLVVVDSEYPLDKIKALKAKGKIVIGYVSIGEIDSFRSYYNQFKAEYLGDNPFWSDGQHKASYVDPRNGKWPAYVLENLLPAFYQKSFDGVFLDTIDSPIALEAGWVSVKSKKPEDLQGMTKAFVALIYAMKAKFPDKKIFLNRGLSLFDRWDRKGVFFKDETEDAFKTEATKLAKALDFILTENLLYDADKDDSGKVIFTARSEEEMKREIGMLATAKGFNSGLLILSLDYCDVSNHAKMKEIYAAQRARGYLPYVASLDLQTVVPEPAS